MIRSPTEFGAQRQFAVTPFGRIAYYEHGEGPAALFVHGVPLNGYQWHDVIEGVADMRRCLAPDLMGFGYSEVAASQDVALEVQAEMLVAFLDAVGAEQVDVCGNDSGGGVSQILAAKHPARVRSLTLTNCEVHDRWPNWRAWLFFLSLRWGLITRQMKKALRDIESARKALAPFFEQPSHITPADIDMYFGPLVATDDRAALMEKVGHWRRNRDALVAIAPLQRASHVPAQLVWGDADGAFDAEASIGWLRSNLGNLQNVTMVEGGKLFFMAERPEPLVRALRNFWNR